METMNSQVVALVVGLLKAARSDATFRKILDASPQLNELLDPLQGKYGAAQSRPLWPHFGNPLEDQPVSQSHDRAERGMAPSGSLSLSPRQCDILRLIALGRSNKEIARTIGVTPETVKTHIKSIFVKLAVEKRAQAVARAQILGLVNAHAGY